MSVGHAVSIFIYFFSVIKDIQYKMNVKFKNKIRNTQYEFYTFELSLLRNNINDSIFKDIQMRLGSIKYYYLKHSILIKILIRTF